ncbi:hypothetical protein [Streptomyces sp. 135]|uniref:hypothetical protein n=1 Tax=Streptomyces sp. 135 TaxID=2838850 RepID=UPI001CBA9C13|nr:hypothetical protein [Streptomyces sp. 135]
MTGHETSHLPGQGRAVGTAAPFHPRLGDPARDSIRGGRIGVVVALPQPGTTTYHLRPPGGGDEWAAPADGSALRPVPAQVTHVTPMKRDVVYDSRAHQGAMPVTVHYEDGGTSEAVLILTPAQLELYAWQVERIIGLRETAGKGSS